MFHELVLKYAPWSISKAGSLERCQRQYLLKYVEKVPEGPSPKSGRTGTAVHYVLEHGIINDNDDPQYLEQLLLDVSQEKKLLTNEYTTARSFLPACSAFIQRVRAFKLKFGVKKVMVEFKAAMLANFEACDFFDKDGLLRGVIDLGLITNDDVFICIDHKTGKPKPVSFHHPQLYSYALMVAAHFPVRAFQGVIHYVGEPELQRMEALSRDFISERLRPWIESHLNSLVSKIMLIEKREIVGRTGWQCEWCPYVYEPSCPEGRPYVEKKGHRHDDGPAVNL